MSERCIACLLYTSIFDQPDGAAAGCALAAEQGAEFEICDPGLGVWVNDVNIIWNEKKQDNGR